MKYIRLLIIILNVLGVILGCYKYYQGGSFRDVLFIIIFLGILNLLYRLFSHKPLF